MNQDDIKLSVKPQKIFLEVLKSDSSNCIICGEIDECYMNLYPQIILKLKHISRYGLEVATPKVSKCSKCEGTGLTWNE